MSEPRYPYVHVVVPSDQVEMASLELFELGASGIEERDTDTLVKSRVAPGSLLLVASFDDEATAHEAREALSARYPAHVEHVVGDGWRDAWRAYFKPLRIGQRLVVRPSWEEYSRAPDELVITLDPGQAFGTGTHESTQLVLAALPAQLSAATRVLDVGTGSGILAIACRLLGAERVDAIDVDSLAITAARENAALNGVAEGLSVTDTPLGQLTGAYALVLANIEARVLVPCAASLSARVAPGGKLLLSGLLLSDVDPVRAAYAQLEEVARPVRGDWCALVLQKEAD